MALPKQTISIPISGGLQEKADPFLVEPPGLLESKNVRHSKQGRIGKRFGYEAITTVDFDGDAGHSLFVRDAGLNAISKQRGIVTYSEGRQDWNSQLSDLLEDGSSNAWYPVPVGVESRNVVSNLLGAGFPSQAKYFGAHLGGGDYICVTWISADEDGNNSPYMLVEDYNGGVVFGPYKLRSTGVSGWLGVRVGVAGSSFIVVAQRSSNASLYYWTIDASGGISTPGDGTVLSTASGNYVYDVCSNTTSELVHVVCRDSGGTLLRVINVNESGTATLTSNISSTTVSGVMACAWHPTRNELGVVYVGTTGDPHYTTVNPTTHVAVVTHQSLAAATAVLVLGIAPHYGGLSPYYTFLWTDSGDATNAEKTVIAGGAGSYTTYNARLAVAPFVVNNRTYYGVCQSMAAAEVQDPAILIVTPAGLVTGGATTGRAVPVARIMSDRTIRYVGVMPPATPLEVVEDEVVYLVHESNVGVAGGSYDTGISRTLMDFLVPPLKSVEHNRVSYFANGLVFGFDGLMPVDVTHYNAPVVTATDMGTAGSVDAGDHSYILVFEYEDAEGNLHRSLPSAAEVVTFTAPDDEVDISYAAPGVFANDLVEGVGLRVALYRTLVDRTEFRLVKRESPVAHPTIAGYYQITDTASDTSISANELLYTDGGVVENSPPPPARDILKAKRRVFLIDAEKPDYIWYSKYLQDRTAPEFSSSFVVTLPDGSHATALAEIDSNIVIFTNDSVFVLAGDGPLDTGLQDTFSTPTRVSSDIGCICRNSVVSGPFGVMFLSKRGIYTLSRSLDLEFTGAAVEDQVSPSLELILRATVHPEYGEARFLHTSGYVLTYNYIFGTWSKWSGGYTGAFDATVHDGKYIFAKMNTSTTDLMLVNSELAGGYTDSDSTGNYDEHIEMSITTPWIKVGGVQSFQRVRKALFLGTEVAACPINISIGYDYSSSFADTKSFTQAEIDALTVFQLGVHVPRQKCQSIRFKVDDDIRTGGSTGGGYTLTNLTLELGLKPGPMRLPAVNKK